jgi:predicted protein tyrosine phosphatase
MSIAGYQEVRPHIIISIGDPNDELAPICEQPACKGILRLQFHDWDDKNKIIFDRLNTPESRKYIFYSESQAKQVFDFVQTHIKEVECILCQCDAGISRSAGMAAALSRILNGTDEYFFKRYIPNSRVYRITFNQWGKELQKW